MSDLDVVGKSEADDVWCFWWQGREEGAVRILNQRPPAELGGGGMREASRKSHALLLVADL
jgi:hypothetical protein